MVLADIFRCVGFYLDVLFLYPWLDLLAASQAKYCLSADSWLYRTLALFYFCQMLNELNAYAGSKNVLSVNIEMWKALHTLALSQFVFSCTVGRAIT